MCIRDRLVEALDAGPIAAYEPFALEPEETAVDAYRKALELGAPLLARSLAAAAAGQLATVPQIGEPTYAAKLDRDDLSLDPSGPWAEQHARVLLGPWPRGIEREIVAVELRRVGRLADLRHRRELPGGGGGQRAREQRRAQLERLPVRVDGRLLRLERERLVRCDRPGVERLHEQDHARCELVLSR